MSSQALRIVKEESARAAREFEFSPQHPLDALHALETSIIARIEKECIEIPDCPFCGKPEIECTGISQGETHGRGDL